MSEGSGELASLTQAEMTVRVEAGVAWPLLAGGVPGPMRLAGRWWAVGEGGADYRPVTGDRARRLDQHAARLDAAAIAVRQAHTRGSGGLGRRL
jgi:hypothetical protein